LLAISAIILKAENGVNLHRCGQASDQAYAVRHVFKPYAHRHALRQAHPGEDRVDHGKTLLVGLRV
jgi:hypothetical protein